VRFREMMAELPSTLSYRGSDDGQGVADFSGLLGPEQFVAFLGEIVETLDSGRDPGAFRARWIEVVVERMPAPETTGHKR
jgi:hypothetical protein